MKAPRTAHLLYGPVAAGKSTYALQLAAKVGAVRFAIDDWMQALFGPDKTADMSFAWAMDRVGRCQAMIWATAEQILSSGRDVVLEIGLMRECERNSMRERVEQSGHRALFHFVDAARDVRLQRVRKRNADKGATYSFDVTVPMFEAIESYFEPQTAREHGHVAVAGPRAHG